MIELQRLNMVRNQCKPAGVEDELLLEGFLKIPREDFLQEKYKSLAYSDGEWPSIDNCLMSRPEMQAQLLEAGQIQPSDKIIIIGSSYLAAITSLLASKVLLLNGQSLLENYAVEVVPFQLDNLSNYKEYNKVIVEKVLSEEELHKILAWTEPEIFFPQFQGEGIAQKLIKSKGGKKELLGEIYLV
jgi:protein-L-isoaspartate O-methyltransferase